MTETDRTGEGIPGAAVRAGTTACPALARLGVLLLGLMVAAQIASGLQPQSVRLISLIVWLLAAAALCFAAAAFPVRQALAAFGAAAGTGYAAEWVGIRTGLPFGQYTYAETLWPRPGGVPVIVALAWGGMGLAAYALACRATWGRPAVDAAPVRVALGALALTAWDLFLDPQMLRVGLWVWTEPGPYRGVPVGNFLGWLLVSLLVMTLVEGILAGRGARSAGLAVIYTVMAVMETLAFAAVLDPPDPLVAMTGGAGMGVFVLLAWGRRRPKRP